VKYKKKLEDITVVFLLFVTAIINGNCNNVKTECKYYNCLVGNLLSGRIFKKKVLAISEKFSGTGIKLFFSLVIICSGSQRFHVLGPIDIGVRRVVLNSVYLKSFRTAN